MYVHIYKYYWTREELAHFYGCMVESKYSYGSEIHPLHVAMYAYSYNSYTAATCMYYTWTLVEFSMLPAV